MKEKMDEFISLTDIVKNLDELGLNKMEYKGYIIDIVGSNESLKNTFISIYDNIDNYEKKESLENIILSSIDLKENIINYINEHYIDNSKDEAYFTFILGYDLLQDNFKNSPVKECDVNYNFCRKIAKRFILSDYYKNGNESAYEMLSKYVKENKLSILKEYERFIGEKDIYFAHNKTLLKTGYRGEQPIALIEQYNGYENEYVIGIDYAIDNDKIHWSRGFYYNNKKEALEDFFKVTKGKYLVSDYKKDRNINDREI